MASYFSQSQLKLITDVLNRLIPPDGKMPGAGQIAVEFLDEAIGSSVELRQLFGRELPAIELEAKSKFSQNFLELADHGGRLAKPYLNAKRRGQRTSKELLIRRSAI